MPLTNDEINKLSAEAQQAVRKKDFNKAIVTLNDIIGKNPDNASIYMQLGVILMRTQAQKEALAHLNKALELAPDVADHWTALGHYHRRRREWALALKALTKSHQIKSGNTQLLFEILRIHRALGDDKSALNISDQLLKIEPENIKFIAAHAELLDANGKSFDALKEFSKLITQDRENFPTPLLAQWFKLMVRFERNTEARQWLQKQVQTNPKSVQLKLLYASSCTNELDYESAVSTLLDAYELAPENTGVNHDLGVLYRFQGKAEQSLKHFKKLLEKDPLNTPALRVVGAEHKYKQDDEYYTRLQVAAAHIAEIPVAKQIQLHYALGKAYDDLNQLAPAFEHFKLGGQIHLKDKPIADAAAERLKENIETNMTRSFFKDSEELGFSSDKPVFILGMPRSGTSLIEQVISSIPDVYGAGELKYITSILNQMQVNNKFKLDFPGKRPQFPGKKNVTYAERGKRYIELLEKISPKTSKRIIDKMPANYEWLGFIHLILPNASIIHSRRHPVETCLSAYRIFFPDGQFWSFDLKRMGKHYREYVDMMQKWKEVLPESTILDVRYEDMVSDLETQSKRLANYIGMEWDEACLNFHKTDRPVRTASVAQVHKAIYTTSINRWHKYKPYLKPLLDEIGDIVKDYEEELAESGQTND